MAEIDKCSLLKRLRTIRGHISGIEKMIEEGKECSDVLIQIAAVTSSMTKVKLMVNKHMVEECLERAVAEEKDLKTEMARILDNIFKYCE